jgi:tripartite-type tricarboxylate transporter receptor subunit TctC
MNRCILQVCLGWALLAAGAQALAQTPPAFPSKAVRVIVPSGAGLTNDIWCRLLAQKLNERLGWTVLVENRPGGNYVIGYQVMTNSPADGHTVLSVLSSMPVVQHTMKPQPFDMLRDMLPITRAVNVQLILVANNEQPFRTAAELVKYAKANPGKMSYGALNLGSLTHLAGELFKMVVGIDMVNVAYNGEALVLDTISGRLQAAVLTTSSTASHIQSGRLRGLAILGPSRSPILPSVPTVAEAGLPAIDADGWQGLAVRVGTPQPIFDRLTREMTTVIQSEDFQARLRAQGALPVSETPEQFRQKIESDLNSWARLVASGKVQF